MKVINRIEVSLENFEKCSVICDQDSSLGQLFDFACAFKSFISQKIKESEVTENKQENIEE